MENRNPAESNSHKKLPAGDILKIRNLSFSFPGGPEILSDIDFSLKEGSLTIISGPNGSGKTVLMKHFNGLLLPSVGKVYFRGISTLAAGAGIREKIGLVFQDADACILGQTVWDDLMYGPENLRMEKDLRVERGEKLLRDFGLYDKKDMPPRFLSGGEKKKLTLAGILIMGPEVVVLDEPFVGLDYPGVRELLKIISDLKEKNTTLIIITHDLEKILAHADRLLILSSGRIAADGVPQKLLDKLEPHGIRRPPERKVSDMSWLV